MSEDRTCMVAPVKPLLRVSRKPALEILEAAHYRSNWPLRRLVGNHGLEAIVCLL
jgi:hypothetical protein